jgi:2-methylcitrate dehydratase PrpD
VKVYPDPSITVSTARVNIKVTLKNGRTVSEAYYPAKGATDNPFTREELVEKFNECAAWGGVSALRAARAVEIVSTLERAKGVAALMDSVVR